MNPSQYNIAQQLVEGIHQNFQGFHPGYRSVHANGRYYSGLFKASPEAKQICRAVHMQGDPIPVTVRHSNSASGSPWGPATTVSMATKFYLPNGTVTDIIALPLPVFVARTPEEVLHLLEAMKPDASTGQPDREKLNQFLASHPWIATAFQLVRSLPAAVSFAQTVYHALHAFRFVNEKNEAVLGRYHWEPEAEVAGQSFEDLQKLPSSYLYDELEGRLQKAAVKFHLILQIAGESDPTNDPTVQWPADRKRVKMGELELIRPITTEQTGDTVMLHDPTRLTDGIELSDDPILAARRGIYELSAAYRTGGWKNKMTTADHKGCPFQH